MSVSDHRKNIRLHHHENSDETRENQAVPEDVSQDCSLIPLLIGGCACNNDALSIDYLSYYTAGAVGRRCENWGDSYCLRRNLLQVSEQHIRGGVASCESSTQPSEQRREKREKRTCCGKCQSEVCIQSAITDCEAEAQHCSDRKQREADSPKRSPEDLEESPERKTQQEPAHNSIDKQTRSCSREPRECCNERRRGQTLKNRSVRLGPVQCFGMVFVGSRAAAVCVAKLAEFSQKGNPLERYDGPRRRRRQLLPSFRGESPMQLVRMVSTMVLKLAGIQSYCMRR